MVKTNTEKQVSSDRLHNYNCFNYLRKIEIADPILNLLPDLLAGQLLRVRGKNPHNYDETYPYGDLYKLFYAYIENNLQKIHRQVQKASESDQHALDVFIKSFYDNDNRILEATFSNIKEIPLAHFPASKALEDTLARHVSDKGERVNLHSFSPAETGSLYRRMISVISPNFKPQYGTSLSTVRHYNYNRHSSFKEFRFGTQGQRHNGEVRVSPLFESFLDIQSQDVSPNKIAHIYFNNLARDRKDAEGKKEAAFTMALEGLEVQHPKIAVITLPADKGFMEKNSYKNIDLEHDAREVYQEFLHIALEDGKSKQPIRDFHISREIRNMIFSENGQKELHLLENLLGNSIDALGLSGQERISSAQRQAVWFHFIKFELTNHIISTLEPKSINFSCKDAIDRGGVSSAYYNLMKSFESKCTSPMSREEFEQALHAAPVMVKARGMNHHLQLIWNVIDNYVTNQYEQIKGDPARNWLIEWRDANCPHARVEHLSVLRIAQLKRDIREAQEGIVKNSPKAEILTQAKNILDVIEKQHIHGVSGKRLLLSAASATAAMAFHPEKTTQNITARYEHIAEKLLIKHPGLTALRGLMKMFLGSVIVLCTLGQKTGMLKSGFATFSSSYEEEARKELQANMKDCLRLYKEEQSPSNSDEEGLKLK